MPRKPDELPSAEALHERFNYDALTGIIVSRSTGQRAFATTAPHGALSGKFSGRKFYAHRIAWIMFHGSAPEFVDHINGDRSDNRIKNLRSVPHAVNMRNKAAYRNNMNGEPNIYTHTGGKSWRVSIRHEGRRLHVGTYPTIQEARTARDSKWAQLGFHQNHGRIVE